MPLEVLEEQDFSVDCLDSRIGEAIKSLDAISSDIGSYVAAGMASLEGTEEELGFYRMRLGILKTMLMTYLEGDRKDSRKVASYAVHVLNNINQRLKLFP